MAQIQPFSRDTSADGQALLVGQSR